MMGWFATAGSFSRILLPIVSGYLDKSVDNSPFNIVLFMLCLSYLGIILLKPMMKIYIEIVPVTESQKIRNDNNNANNNANNNNGNNNNEIDQVNDVNPYTGIRAIIYNINVLWKSLSLVDKWQAVAMIFLMIFTIIDLVSMSGGVRKEKGFDIGFDQGRDID